jgi:hypothetical protein
MKIENTLYKVKYDGDLLSYKCRGIACYIFSILGWTKHLEIPVNTLLHQEVKSFGFVNLVRLYINHYSHGQKKLTARKIGRFALIGLNKKKIDKLVMELNKTIDHNLRDESNLGLHHISKSDLEVFYARVNKRQPISEESVSGIPMPGMATMQAHKISQAS